MAPNNMGAIMICFGSLFSFIDNVFFYSSIIIILLDIIKAWIQFIYQNGVIDTYRILGGNGNIIIKNPIVKSCNAAAFRFYVGVVIASSHQYFSTHRYVYIDSGMIGWAIRLKFVSYLLIVKTAVFV